MGLVEVLVRELRAADVRLLRAAVARVLGALELVRRLLAGLLVAEAFVVRVLRRRAVEFAIHGLPIGYGRD